MARMKRQWDLVVPLALAAVVIIPTALVLALGIRALEQAGGFFEAQIARAARQRAADLSAAVLAEADLELESTLDDLGTLAAGKSAAPRIEIARAFDLSLAVAILDLRFRPLYPAGRAMPLGQTAENAEPRLGDARRALVEQGPEAPAAIYRQVMKSSEVGRETFAVAAGELAGLLSVRGERDAALAVYRELAESRFCGDELDAALLARFRIWELEGSPQSADALSKALFDKALSAPEGQVRFYLSRMESAGHSVTGIHEALVLREADEAFFQQLPYEAVARALGPSGGRKAWLSGASGAVAAARVIPVDGGEGVALVRLDLAAARRILERQLAAEAEPASPVTYRLDAEGGAADNVALSVELPPPFGRWSLSVIAPGGDLSALGEARSRILRVGMVLAGAGVLAGLSVVMLWARRRARIARLQTDFVANVTHELKTPLTAIKGLAETMLLDRLTSGERRVEFLAAIVSESDRLARLVNNVLDFSRLDRGGPRLRLRKVDLRVPVGEAAEAFRRSLRDDDAVLEVTLPESSLGAVVDADAVAGIVFNLLDNAYKYSQPPRKIALLLSEAGGEALLSVSDNGEGLGAPEQRRVFRKFYRIDTSLSAATQGAGLGLALVKAYAQAHDGAVSVESTPGKGSVFTVRLLLGAEGGADDGE